MYARALARLSPPFALFFALGCGGNESTGTGGSPGASSSASGGTGGMGGMGGGCVTVKDCPPSPSACVIGICLNGQCGTSFTPAGTPLMTQIAGDCQGTRCDGMGNTVNVVDNADLPVDGLPCTADICTAGVPSNPPLLAGAVCGQGMLCDGKGACVGCLSATDCPGQDGPCQSRICVNGACGISFAPAGTPTPTQTAGDCKVNQCDGMGVVLSVVDSTDLPVDGLPCTADVCTAGVPSNPPLVAGTGCGLGMLCNGNGACVGCLSAMDCPGQDGPCQTRTCTNGVCGLSFVPAGVPLATQTSGDCKVNQCDGAGAMIVVNDNADLPIDGNPCTGDICAAGVPSNPPLSAGAACNQNGGSVCDGMGGCVLTFVVVRVGDGMAALSTSSAPIFLEQRLFDGTLLVKPNNPLPLPTAVNGNNRALTLSGTATAEGNLSLSASGSYLTIAGYDAMVGTAMISATASNVVNRVIGRIDASGNIDTTTRLDVAFNGNSVRSATTTDGTGFWVSGGSSGIHYAVLGMTGSTQILAVPDINRVCLVQAGQLYASSGAPPYTDVFSIGTGTPTMAGQTATPLPGMPTMNASPNAFVILDRNPNVPGIDTLYVGDDRTPANGGGVQKWTFDGLIWTLTTTFNNGITSGVRGLAGGVTGNNVALIGTTANNKIVVYVDDGAMSPAGTVIASGAANIAYRGVAVSPK